MQSGGETVEREKNYFSAFLNGGKYFGHHRDHRISKRAFLSIKYACLFLVLYIYS